MSAVDEPRPYCYRCDRTAKMCLCDVVPTLANRTGVQILQHAGERRHPLGTTRLLRLGLAAVDVHVLFPRHPDGTCPPVALPPGSGLLYPSAEAQELSTAQERPEHLVVIDGTWAQAHRLYRDNAWIRDLPHYRISPVEPSQYRIRREPRFECLSTLEAVVEAIGCLEPELEGRQGLVAAFRRMIDDQIGAMDDKPDVARTRTPRPRVRVVRPTFERPDDVVVAHVEPVHVARDRDGPEHMLHLVAVRLTTGAVFDAVVDHAVVPDAFHRGQLRLTEADLAGGAPLEAVRAAFATFCGDAPVLASWSTCTRDTLQRLDLPGAEHVLLRAAWSNRTHAKVPPLEDLLVAEAVEVPDVPVRGRGAEHLARSLAIARRLCESPG